MILRFARTIALSVAVLFAASTPSYAVTQGTDPDSPASIAFECKGKVARKQLETIFAGVQSQYQKISTVSADFNQDSFLAALNEAESSAGKVLFSKPGRMKWIYTAPEEQQFVLRDHTVWLYQPEIKQVLIDELSQVLLTDLPVSFLMGVGNLKEGFSLIDGCRTSVGTVLALEPQKGGREDGENSLKTFKLLVTSEGFPAGAQVFDLVGNITTIALRNIKENPVLEEGQFSVQYPAGTDINDRRKSKKGE